MWFGSSARRSALGAALSLSAGALGSAQAPAPAEGLRPVRVCAGGDVTLGTNLDAKWPVEAARRLRAQFGLSAQPESLLAPLRPLVADADVLLLNVETAIGGGPFTPKCGRASKNCFAFRGDPDAAPALRSLAAPGTVVVGNVANNHARDAGNENVRTTIAHLARAGILATGDDTLATPVILPDGTTIGILGFYTSTETPDVRDISAVRRHVQRAVEMYGTVIVTAHMGAEGVGAQRTRDATEYFLESRIDRGNPVAFARAALDAGAALVIGHGPHVLRAVEWRDDRLVLYSLGNLATYGPFNLLEPMNRGAIACVDLSGRQVVGAELRPTVQLAPGIVKSDPSARALKLMDSLSVLDFPATGGRIDSRGEIKRPD